MNIENPKIEEATELIKLAINDYDAFLKKINTFKSQKSSQEPL